MQQPNIKLIEAHKHVYEAQIVFDYQGNDYMYGRCWCGDKDM